MAVTSQQQNVLNESTRVAQRAAKLIGGTFQQGVGFKSNKPVPTTMNASDMATPPSPINVPQVGSTAPTPTPTVPTPNGTTTDANGNATTPPATSTAPAAPTQSTGDWIKEQFKSLGTTLGTKSKATEDLQKQQQLAKKTEQAASDYNSFNQAKLTHTQTLEKMYENRNSGISSGAANAGITDFERKSNANLANLAIVANASQGLLTAAQQNIKDKIDAQFQPVQDQIDYLTKFAQVNNNDLTESEKFKLQEQADQKKTELSDLTSVVDNLHQAFLDNNAPQTSYSALDKITQDYTSGKITAQEAQSKMYQAAGQYGVSTASKLQKANLAKMNAEAAALVGEPGQKADDLAAYANEYAATGKLPSVSELKASGLSVGQVTAIANESPKSDGSLVSKNTGVKSSTLSPAQEDGISSLYDLNKKLTQLSELYKDTRFILPSQKNEQFRILRAEVVDLLARARTGAAITEYEQREYEKKLPLDPQQTINFYPQTKIIGLRSSISGKLDTLLDTNQLSLYGYSKVKVGGVPRTVGEVIEIGSGENKARYRVLPNGRLSDIF